MSWHYHLILFVLVNIICDYKWGCFGKGVSAAAAKQLPNITVQEKFISMISLLEMGFRE